MESIKNLASTIWKTQDQGAHQSSRGKKEVKGTTPNNTSSSSDKALKRTTSPQQQEKLSSQSPKTDSQNLSQVREMLDRELSRFNFGLDYQIKDKGEIVVKVVNKKTGKVIRQIPPEEMLKLAKEMRNLTGVVLNKTL